MMHGLNLGKVTEVKVETAVRVAAVLPDMLQVLQVLEDAPVFEASLGESATDRVDSVAQPMEVSCAPETITEVVGARDECVPDEDVPTLEANDDRAWLTDPAAASVALEAIIGGWTGICSITASPNKSEVLRIATAPAARPASVQSSENSDGEIEILPTSTDIETVGGEPLVNAKHPAKPAAEIDTGDAENPAILALDPESPNNPREVNSIDAGLEGDWPPNISHAGSVHRPLVSSDILLRPTNLLTSAKLRHITDTVVLMKDEMVEITLAPEEIGRVRMVLSQRDHSPHLMIWAERPEVLEQLRRSATDLLQSFHEAGIENASFEFRDNSPGNGEGSWPEANGEIAMVDPIGPEILQYSAGMIGVAAGARRLDIRM
ncbi:flagellar hook-length control protein FliK [Paracoccus caeni]|nr:flagellar hook-length control protein FliK [Paracoccus caeni]